MSGRRTTPLPREMAAVYLRKAMNFLRGMDAVLAEGNADAAGLSAIHATISSCDALTVFRLGVRSAAQDHSEVLKLLPEAGAPTAVITQVRLVLSLKNKAEYEARLLTQKEAVRIAASAKGVVEYVGSIVSK